MIIQQVPLENYFGIIMPVVAPGRRLFSALNEVYFRSCNFSYSFSRKCKICYYGFRRKQYSYNHITAYSDLLNVIIALGIVVIEQIPAVCYNC